MAVDAYVATLAWLYRLEAKRGIDLMLDRIRRAAVALGNPERAAPTLHVAGTNGKGSTAAMMAAMLAADGRRVGLYTSPHLVSFRERIAIAGLPIEEQAVVDGVRRIRATLGSTLDLTCFEVMTLLAWLAFAEARVDVVVLEAGLGGRLDATNIVTPEVAVITNIGFDHEEYLGHDLASIAREKAGIIKKGVPVVSGATGEAATIIADAAAAAGSAFELVGRDFALTPSPDGTLEFRSRAGTIGALALRLGGAHQRSNAALAVRALELAPALTPPPSAIATGLATVRWPGRLQVVRREPLVLLDGAHNAAGIDALVSEVRALAAGRRVRVLFGVMRDKGWQSMLRALGEVATEIVLTRPRQPRSAPPESLMAAVSCAVRTSDDPVEAYRTLVAESAADDVVVIAGSLFLVGDLLPVIDPTRAADAERERAAARLAGRL
ncbi:MAG: folylpolyglutamate synthase/dihydrofolate synthase family protein [Candidatus Binatia bacterium]